MNRPFLFIADLHLSDDTPDLNALFFDFLRDWQNRAGALYILGDFFDVWTGDDTDSETAARVAAALHAFSQNAPVYFIGGNRDFLLGHAYAVRCGMTLLSEKHLLQWQGKTVLLTHGDEMCTDDTAYLRYRRIIRHPIVKKILLSLPQSRRRRIAAQLRETSRRRKQSGQSYAVSDVTENGVQAALAQFVQTDIIIHGHTHRPNTHCHTRGGKTVQRYVLPDWHNGQGGYLLADENGFQFFRLPENGTKPL